MRIALLLLSALVTLLSIAPTPSSALGADGLRFTLVTKNADAQWPGRRQAFARQLTGSYSYIIQGGTSSQRRSITNPYIFMGGFVPDWEYDYNDIWLSADGATWVLAAGVTSNQDEAGTPDTWPTDPNNGGTFTMLPSQTILRASQSVWTSANVITWKETVPGNIPYQQRNLPTMVTTSRGVIIRAAGQDTEGAFRNDVITSRDSGRNWISATEEAAWAARFVNTMLTIPSDIGGGKDITYIIAGRDLVDNFNDVWASSDDGKSWTVISGQGPFLTRASANGAVTKDGLLILAGGFADDAVGRYNTDIANDVWLSMNGGYTWGRCVLDAEWEDRFQQAVFVNNDGYLMVMSGATGSSDSSYVQQDVWRSSTSFHDLPAIAKACGLTVPSCGTGLKCWPGNGTVVATDGSFVSCSACPHPSLGSTSSAASMAMTVALAVFVVLFVLAAAAAGYMFWKQQQAAKGGAASYGGAFGSADTSGLITA